ncbi:MAG: DUF3221 domain-containing protein [Actinobacteria bacterium]|nr:DUF3221 domain-containing protein [Actinomycetota bacterium]
MKTYKIFALFTVIVVALAAGILIFSGCIIDNVDVNPTYAEPGIRGLITEINSGNGNVSILVEGNIEEDTRYDKALVKITGDTMIQKDEMSRLFEVKDLKIGGRVEVYFTGPVAESYPVQGLATIVRILTK